MLLLEKENIRQIFMIKLPIPVTLVLVVITAALIPLPFVKEKPRFRYCGHTTTIWDEIKPWRVFHCCRAGRLVSDLRNIYHAQEVHFVETGAYFTNLTDLAEKNFLRRQFAMDLHLDATTHWFVAVPKQLYLPGSYLLLSNGRIHFNPSTQATTNDYILYDPGQPNGRSRKITRLW